MTSRSGTTALTASWARAMLNCSDNAFLPCQVERVSHRLALALHPLLERVSLAVDGLLADPLLPALPGVVEAAVELLHDLERPAALEHVDADELLLELVGQRLAAGLAQLGDHL